MNSKPQSACNFFDGIRNLLYDNGSICFGFQQPPMHMHMNVGVQIWIISNRDRVEELSPFFPTWRYDKSEQ